MSTSSETTETSKPTHDQPATGSSVIHDRVAAMANASADRTDFYKRLAAEIVQNLQCGLVAIEAAHWAAPMMLVNDESLSTRIARSDLKGLLSTATVAPVACNLSLDSDSDSGSDSDSANDNDVARGLRIEIVPSPDRAALILLYPTESRPSAMTQIGDLRLLQSYGEATRSVVRTFPQLITDPSVDEVSQSEQTLAPAPHPGLAGHRSLQWLHRDLDLDATCYRIANESRRLLDCDRSIVLVSRGSRFKVAAVSGVAVVDKRGNAIRSAERMVQAAVVMSRPLVLPGDDPLPPQIQAPLDAYLDETGVNSAIVLPLHWSGQGSEDDDTESTSFDPLSGDGDCIGVIVLEYFSGEVPASVNLPMTVVAAEATLALRNSREHSRVFGLSLWKSVGGLVGDGRWPWVVAGLTAVIALLVASLVIQIDHQVIAKGTAEPSLRRDVFATIDGTVKTLHVTDGQTVKAGDVLFELENAELESRAEALTGEIQTATSRLASIQSVRLSSDADPAQSSRMAIELRQVESELANLRGQLTILETQQKELVITSPIDGNVVGWQLKRRLSDRPITRGNLLVSVVNPTGPWSLKMQIPDRDAGAVIDARKTNPNLPIEFAVATLPESSFAAELEEMSTASRLDESGQYVIDAGGTIELNPNDTDRFEPFNIETMRSGADITAKVTCGKRSILRSWFGDVFDFVHRNILFYF
ncbi:MAG: biotin/lipoyl-binding protein [Rubripirellula sp.]